MLKAARFLSPKADVVFKKVFGCHENLLRSFLNAMIPLPKGRIITRLEYLTPENVPVIPEFKRTIVDVKCFDQEGRHFIVEMQMEWTASFASRILYGACQAYTYQLKKGGSYQSLAPVYALGLINENFDHSEEFYHHYKICQATNLEKTLEGIEIVLVELQKFKPTTTDHMRLRSLWIRFLNEAESLYEVPEDFKDYPELVEALELTQESAYSRSELDFYNSYWDSVSSEKTLLLEAYDEGIVEGEKKGRLEEKHEIARNLKGMGFSLDQISTVTGLSLKALENL